MLPTYLAEAEQQAWKLFPGKRAGSGSEVLNITGFIPVVTSLIKWKLRVIHKAAEITELPVAGARLCIQGSVCFHMGSTRWTERVVRSSDQLPSMEWGNAWGNHNVNVAHVELEMYTLQMRQPAWLSWILAFSGTIMLDSALSSFRGVECCKLQATRQGSWTEINCGIVLSRAIQLVCWSKGPAGRGIFWRFDQLALLRPPEVLKGMALKPTFL